MSEMESKYIVLYNNMVGDYTELVCELFNNSSNLEGGWSKSGTKTRNAVVVYNLTIDKETIISVYKKRNQTSIILSRKIEEPLDESEERINRSRKVLTSILNKESFVLH